MLVDLGRNSLRLHCLLKAFDWLNLTGQIGCKSIEIDAGRFGWKFTEITLYAYLVKFSGHNLNGFTPNSTGQIGCKSIEIDTGQFG